MFELLVCFYSGSDLSLSAIPENWGALDKDGLHASVKSLIVSAFVFSGSFTFVSSIIDLSERRFDLEVVQIELRSLRQIVEVKHNKQKIVEIKEAFNMQRIKHNEKGDGYSRSGTQTHDEYLTQVYFRLERYSEDALQLSSNKVWFENALLKVFWLAM